MKMSSPLRQFMIVSIVGMTITLLALLYFHNELSQEYLREYLDSHNKNLSIVLRNSLLAEGLDTELIESRSALSDSMLARIDLNLEQELRWVPVVKVKIYSRDSIVLYSTNIQEIGADAKHNKGVQSALAGTPISGQVHPNHLNEFDNIFEAGVLHQQYIPIKSRETGDVIGVFETYLNIYEVVRKVEVSQRAVFWLIGGILAIFYLALATTFLTTHRLLHRETQQREAYLNELHTVHADLEQRVEQRTTELDHARIFLQSVIDGIADPLVVIRPDFTIALMNHQAKKQIPPDQDEKNYRYCYQISHRLDAPCTEPDHPCSFAEVMEKGCPVRVRHTHHDTDGTSVVLELITTPLYASDGSFEGVIEVEHDVTRLVNMQQVLFKNEAHLQAIMDHVPDAILTCDSGYTIQSTNHSARILFNAEETDLVGKNLKELFSADSSAKEFMSEIATHQQCYFKRIDGTEFPSDLWVGPLEKTSGESSYIVVVHDITERLRAQRELETTRQQFFHQDKMAAIGQLAAGILHEVGNPIAAIAGAVSAVQHSHTSDDQDDELSCNIELINEQILRLGKITREIADFSSPKPRERELLDLNELLRSTAGLLSYDRRFSSIGVQLQLDKNLPAIVGVADQLTQVFMNLLINAMDACALLELEEDCIVLKSEIDGDRVHVCVQDYGPGMSSEVLGHVMELFYTTKPVGKGSGLGLSLCDTIVREHGGEMRIDSEEGVGTQVHVILPIDGSEDDSADIEMDAGEESLLAH
jgi:PAS domain S-box-containing protein